MKISVIRGKSSPDGEFVSFPIFVFIGTIGGQIALIGYDVSKPDSYILVHNDGLGRWTVNRISTLSF